MNTPPSKMHKSRISAALIQLSPDLHPFRPATALLIAYDNGVRTGLQSRKVQDIQLSRNISDLPNLQLLPHEVVT